MSDAWVRPYLDWTGAFVPPAHADGLDVSTCFSPDPRFEGGGGSSKLNYDIFRKAYGFLGAYQDSEIEELKKSLKKEKNQVQLILSWTHEAQVVVMGVTSPAHRRSALMSYVDGKAACMNGCVVLGTCFRRRRISLKALEQVQIDNVCPWPVLLCTRYNYIQILQVALLYQTGVMEQNPDILRKPSQTNPVCFTFGAISVFLTQERSGRLQVLLTRLQQERCGCSICV